jgi:hypothetical protein
MHNSGECAIIDQHNIAKSKYFQEEAQARQIWRHDGDGRLMKLPDVASSSDIRLSITPSQKSLQLTSRSVLVSE